jgi:glutamine synthetase
MCRPQAPESCSSGWHLHQSLVRSDGRTSAFADEGTTAGELSSVGRSYVAGLLHHARAACVFAVPTVNGYKRFVPYSMAPDRVLWAYDNRAAMIRVVGSGRTGDVHVENRVGEPAANPYLAIAAQLLAGLDGVDRGLDPGPSADEPYATEATRLPTSLREAVCALDRDSELRSLMGPALVDHFVGLKRAEVARFEAAVTDWEQREYLHLF